MPSPKQDNSTFAYKVELRRKALAMLAERGIDRPVVMETHGGAGKLFNKVYAHLERGVVFEKDAQKADTLAKQRPTWAVYEADCVAALKAGVGAHLAVNLLDVDPYGECWHVLENFFTSTRPVVDTLFVVVNDGLRHRLLLTSGWITPSMQEAILKYGNNLYPVYLEACEMLMSRHAERAGYVLTKFSGYYCGRQKNMTHFLAVLERG